MLMKNMRFIIALWDDAHLGGSNGLKGVSSRNIRFVERTQTPTRFEVNHLKRPLSIPVDQSEHQVRPTAEIHVHLFDHCAIETGDNKVTGGSIAQHQAVAMEKRQFSAYSLNFPSIKSFPLNQTPKPPLVDE